ncbi:hypothetical protein ACVWXQ_005471 [Bradyrhizobium sp. S3.14.4]
MISSLVASHGPTGPKVSCDLPLVHWPRRSGLEGALGDVVADAIAGDVVQRIGFRDILGAGADDGGDLDFPVELGRAARLFDRIVRAGQRGVGLHEDDRLGRDRGAGFLGVVAVVEADGDEFRDAGDGRAEARLAGDGGQGGRVKARQLLQGFRRIGLAGQVLHMRRQVAQLAGFVDQAGLFHTLFAITNKLHSRFSPGDGPIG